MVKKTEFKNDLIMTMIRSYECIGINEKKKSDRKNQ